MTTISILSQYQLSYLFDCNKALVGKYWVWTIFNGRIITSNTSTLKHLVGCEKAMQRFPYHIWIIFKEKKHLKSQRKWRNLISHAISCNFSLLGDFFYLWRPIFSLQLSQWREISPPPLILNAWRLWTAPNWWFFSMNLYDGMNAMNL